MNLEQGQEMQASLREQAGVTMDSLVKGPVIDEDATASQEQSDLPIIINLTNKEYMHTDQDF